MALMEIAEAGNALKLTPWVAARVPVGADVAASQPTVVGTIQVGTELILAVNRALAAPCIGDQRRRRTRCLVTGCCGLVTQAAHSGLWSRPAKGVGSRERFGRGGLGWRKVGRTPVRAPGHRAWSTTHRQARATSKS